MLINSLFHYLVSLMAVLYDIHAVRELRYRQSAAVEVLVCYWRIVIRRLVGSIDASTCKRLHD